MSAPLSFCSECYTTSVEYCVDPYFPASLEVLTEYKISIKNHFGQVYTQYVTTDDIGGFSLDTSLYPSEFLNPYSGIFTLTVKDVHTQGAVDIIIAYGSYPCIAFDIYQETATN